MKTKLTVVLIDGNFIDNFVNQKLFSVIGITNTKVIWEYTKAMTYLASLTVPPDFVFISIHLPSTDGFDFYCEIKKLPVSFDHTKFFFLHNSINPDDKKRAGELNVEFIKKPLSIQKINKLLADN